MIDTGLTAAQLAGEAIGLFIEYRDQYGSARTQHRPQPSPRPVPTSGPTACPGPVGLPQSPPGSARSPRHGSAGISMTNEPRPCAHPAN